MLQLVFGNLNFEIRRDIGCNLKDLKVLLINSFNFNNLIKEKCNDLNENKISVLSVEQLSNASFLNLFIYFDNRNFYKKFLELPFGAIEELSSFLYYNDSETRLKNIDDLKRGNEIYIKKVLCKVLTRLCERIPGLCKPERVYNLIFKEISDKIMVSLIIPTYNGMDFLPEALKSVADQFYKNIELIIIDDGSTDGTRQYCKDKIKKINNFYRVQYFYQQNKGVAAARNLGIKKSKGSLVAMLDHDDYLLPDSIIDRVIPFLMNKKTEVVYANRDTLVNQGYERIRQQRIEPYQTDGFTKLKSNREQLQYLLEKQVTFGFNTMMYQKSIFEKTGYFLEDRKYSGLEHNAFIIKTLYWYYADYVDSVVYLMRRNHSDNNLSKRFENNILRRQLLRNHIFPLALRDLKINPNA